MSIRRIRKELENIEKGSQSNFTICQQSEDLRNHIIAVQGPENTPYEDGIFLVNLKFPENYPFSPPEIKFLTNTYHLNIQTDGTVCLNCNLWISQDWSPAITIPGLIDSLCMFMEDHCHECFSNHEVSSHYVSDKEGYFEKAREYTRKYAK